MREPFKKKIVSLYGLITLFLLALLLGACGNLNPDTIAAKTSEAMPLEEGSANDLVETELVATIATLELPSGGSVTFLDLGEGQVGVGERGPVDKAFVSGALLGQNATPLELYLALKTGDADVPQLLVDDHARQKAEAPRNLSVSLGSLGTQGLDDPGIDDHYCGYDEWKWDWVDAFENLTDYYPVGSGHIINPGSQYTFYPGSHVYNVTNTNQVTYLGACSRDTGGDTMTFEIHRWLPTVVYHLYPTPPTVTWSWKKISTVSVDGYEKYTFYSPIPARYRGRVKALGGAVSGFGIGAAYTKSPPIGFAP